MKKDNRDLLESLIANRLREALENEDENSRAFKEAMEAIDRQLKIDERDLEMKKEELKLEHEKEMTDIKQQHELSREESKQQFEFDILSKRHELELETEAVKSDLEEQREDKNRKFQMELEEARQEFEMDKMEVNHKHDVEKAELDAKQAKINLAIKAVEIAAVAVVAPLIDHKCKTTFAHMLCEFEKDYSFTTMAGKSLSGLFKFKK